MEQLEKAPVPKADSSSSCQWSLQRGPQRTACQLFSGLRKSGFLPPWLSRGTWVTGCRPRIYTERSKEGWEMSDLSLIENRGLRAGRNLHSHPMPSSDEKRRPGRVTQLRAQASCLPRVRGLSESGVQPGVSGPSAASAHHRRQAPWGDTAMPPTLSSP